MAGVRRTRAVVRRRRCDPAAAHRHRRCKRHGGSDVAARARAPAHRSRHVLLRAGRELPEPRAEPAAPGEPRVHRREDARRGRGLRGRVRRGRRPVLLRGRLGRIRPGRLRNGALRRVHARERPRREGHLRRSRQLGRAGDRRARRGHPARQPRRARVHQAPHAKGGRGVRRRGLGPLLLSGLLPGRHRRRAVPAHARPRLARRQAALRDPPPLSRALLHHRRDQLHRLRRAREAPGAEGALRPGGPCLPSRRRVRGRRRLALQRPAVEHRAAASPQPRSAFAGAHGGEAGRGAGRDLRRHGTTARLIQPLDEPGLGLEACDDMIEAEPGPRVEPPRDGLGRLVADDDPECSLDVAPDPRRVFECELERLYLRAQLVVLLGIPRGVPGIGPARRQTQHAWPSAGDQDRDGAPRSRQQRGLGEAVVPPGEGDALTA